MKFYTGVDILKISRMEKSIANPRFLTRVFSQKEIEIYNNRGKPISFLAGNFAAKEAFSKALGTGVRGFALSDISVLRNEFGKPYLEIQNKALDIVKAKNLSFDLSISNEKEYVIAFVVAWEK